MRTFLQVFGWVFLWGFILWLIFYFGAICLQGVPIQ